MIINKPLSMWESTHLQTSTGAQELQNPFSATQNIIDMDTSFNEPYDEVGAPDIKVSGISQHLIANTNKAFDYFYHK